MPDEILCTDIEQFVAEQLSRDIRRCEMECREWKPFGLRFGSTLPTGDVVIESSDGSYIGQMKAAYACLLPDLQDPRRRLSQLRRFERLLVGKAVLPESFTRGQFLSELAATWRERVGYRKEWSA